MEISEKEIQLIQSSYCGFSNSVLIAKNMQFIQFFDNITEKNLYAYISPQVRFLREYYFSFEINKKIEEGKIVKDKEIINYIKPYFKWKYFKNYPYFSIFSIFISILGIIQNIQEMDWVFGFFVILTGWNIYFYFSWKPIMLRRIKNIVEIIDLRNLINDTLFSHYHSLKILHRVMNKWRENEN